MTTLLQQAISEIQKLPAAKQDAIAAVILDELADEQQWDELFARSQSQLSQMAAKVNDDLKQGRVKKSGIDEL